MDKNRYIASKINQLLEMFPVVRDGAFIKVPIWRSYQCGTAVLFVVNVMA
jgi:hypothetical protein